MAGVPGGTTGSGRSAERGRRSTGGQEGPAFQGLAQAVQDRQAVLLDGRDIPADAAEVRSGVLAAESAGDLLPDLHHANVAFRLVVAEGHSEVVQEAERGILAQLQPFDQIARLALFQPAAPRHRRWVRQGIGSQPLRDQFVVPGLQSRQLLGRQAILAGGDGGADGLLG